MGAGRAGAVIKIAGNTMFVVVAFVAVLVSVLALMNMGMTVLAAIGMVMAVRMDAGQRLPAAVGVGVRMIVIVAMGVAMHRAVLVSMSVLVRTRRRTTLDLHFTLATTANCAHALFSYSISISRTRIAVPPVGRS
jgi:hypothetical protein